MRNKEKGKRIAVRLVVLLPSKIEAAAQMDETLISAYCPNLNDNQDKDLISRMIEEDADGTEDSAGEGSQGDGVDSPVTATNKIKSTEESENVKRCLLDQFSSSKNLKKSKNAHVKQILPVIPKGTRQDIVRASISSSYLWKSCKVLRLTKNLRLRSVQSENEGKEIEEFAKWIANIGDRVIGSQCDGESEITVPEHLLLKCEDDPIATIVDSTFPNFRLGIGDLSYLNDSAI
ncbi:PREDICTED: uncharacterized protein LOC109192708 [Ipomoea nil]|uniref:uncharacterized protein LOC109192708 n=1 Tax=Ipomoea nil TaxID=35883 RepID=UPI000900B793|nr:PREDICTED: uncharacterized protein LOC109192708 [Ipomoea nil]